MDNFIRHRGRIVSANFTRPADTTAYTSGDVVGPVTSPAAMVFIPATEDKHDYAKIVSATLIDSANVATKADLELWLLESILTPAADNAPFAPTDAELRTLVGVISFATGSFRAGDASSGAAGNAICESKNIQLAVQSQSAGGALYGVLVVRNAYVPVSGERFDIRLAFED